MSENTPADHQRSLAKQRAVLGVARLIVNALSVGLIFTMLLAVVVLVLEKRSGITLDREQYRGLLLIIFLTLTLSAYVVLEYFQHRRDERDAKAKGQQKRKARDEPAYAPIFVEPAPVPEQTPALAPSPEPGDDGLAVDEPAAVSPSEAVKALPFGLAHGSGAQAAGSIAAQAAAQTTAAHDVTIKMFIESIRAAVAGFDEEPTPFIHFGLRLYVMGACGELARRGALPTVQGKALLIHMLVQMNVTKRDAASFAANANTFAQVPNLRGPIDAGYRAMAHLHDAGFFNIADLIDAVAQWKIQDGICQPPEPVTFMATAIIPAMAGAATPPEDRQRSLRAHTTFVGAALEHFQGREIHNLGNGVIAAFTDASLAVRAAENILEQLDVFARENPKLTVLPHIGIDTEMAAMVNGTYVSAALTRAVTIASLTPTNHIYCSEATCGDAADVFSFEPVTTIENYAELPPVFSTTWSRAPAKGGPAVEYRQIGTMADAS